MFQTINSIIALLVWLAILVILIVSAVYVLQRLRREVKAKGVSNVDEVPLDLESLWKKGELTEAEYQAISSRLGETTRGRGTTGGYSNSQKFKQPD